MSWPATIERGPPTSRAEAGDHLGEPVRAVRVARAVLGVAVQRQIGQHDPEALGQRLDDRLPLAVRQSERVQQHERRAGARLSVGDPGAVVVVIEPKSHDRRSSHSDSRRGNLAGHADRCKAADRGTVLSRNRRLAVIFSPKGCAITVQLLGGFANAVEMQHMKQNNGSPLGLSTSQAAQALGVSLGTIRRWSDMGYLESYRTPGGQRRFSHEQIEQFVGSLEQQQTTQPSAERKAS